MAANRASGISVRGLLAGLMAWAIVSSGGRARIHIRQPANRRLQIELSPFLEVSSWQPLELPESVVDYPAEPRNVVLEYPLGDDSLFFRVQSLAP